MTENGKVIGIQYPTGGGGLINKVSCSFNGFCGASEQEAGAHVTCRQIICWQFGADSSIILKFIALRVEARGDGPFFFLYRVFNSSLVDSTYDCKTR